jgi:hypothetical protein
MGERERQPRLRGHGPAFDAGVLMDQIRAEQNQKHLIENIDDPEKIVDLAGNIIIGRAILDAKIISDITEFYENLPGVKFKRYKPSLLYASRKLIQSAWDSKNHGLAPRTANELFNNLLESNGAIPKEMKTPRRVELENLRHRYILPGRFAETLVLANGQEHFDNRRYLLRERRDVRTLLDAGLKREQSLKPLLINVGILQIMPGYLKEHGKQLPFPEFGFPYSAELGPVSLIYLRA